MIGAIESRPSFKDEWPAGMQAQSRAQSSFSRVFDTTQDSRSTPAPARLYAEGQQHSRVVERRSTPEADPRSAARSQPEDQSAAQGARQEKSARAPADRQSARERPTEKSRPTRDEQAQPADRSSLATGSDQEQALAGAQGQQGQALPAAVVLQGQQGQAGASRVPVDVLIGMAAYRQGVHGIGEAPQGAVQAPGTADSTVLKLPESGQLALPADFHVVTSQDMIELSKSNLTLTPQLADLKDGAASGGPGAGPGHHPGVGLATHGLEQPAPDSALARDQVLQQMGGPATAVNALQAGLVRPLAREGKDGGPGGGARLKAAEGSAQPAGAPALTGVQSGSAAALATSATTVQHAHNGNTGTEAPQRTDPSLINQVVKEARWMLQGNRNEVTLKLQPEHLGELKLKVSQKNGDLTVQMTVDTSAAKHLLDASMADLRQRLQAEQLTQGNLLVQVDVRQGNDSGQSLQFGPRGPEAASSTPVHTVASQEAAPAPAPRRALSGDSNISIYA